MREDRETLRKDRNGYRTLEIQGLMQELKERLIKAGAEQGGEFITITQQFIDEHTYEGDE